jgi:hypothetical protein
LRNLFPRVDRHLVQSVHDVVIGHVLGSRLESGIVRCPSDLVLDGSGTGFGRALLGGCYCKGMVEYGKERDALARK